MESQEYGKVSQQPIHLDITKYLHKLSQWWRNPKYDLKWLGNNLGKVFDVAKTLSGEKTSLLLPAFI